MDTALQDISNPKELLCLNWVLNSFEDPMSVYIIEGIHVRFSMGDMIQVVMPMGAFHSLMREPRLQGKISLEN